MSLPLFLLDILEVVAPYDLIGDSVGIMQCIQGLFRWSAIDVSVGIYSAVNAGIESGRSEPTITDVDSKDI